MTPEEKESDRESRRVIVGFFGPMVMLGTQMAVGMVVFAIVGRFLDSRTGGGIGWTVCGMFIGLFYCAYETWKTVRLINRQSGEDQGKGVAGGKSREYDRSQSRISQ